ncbi:MAG: hypothetical protein KAS23_02355 [Anaerohalosphaera sp.]|nr:hypothetical protein [Anaerohalosphaera sp.]
MKIKIIVLMLINMIQTGVRGQDFKNEEYGISFVLPDQWRIIEYGDMQLDRQKKLDNMFHPFKTLAVCGVWDSSNPDMSQIFIQYRKFEKSNYNKAKRFIQTDLAKERMIGSAEINAKDGLGREINYYKITYSKSDFISSADRAYGVVHYEGDSKPKVIGMDVKFLCRDGWVGLRCFSRGSETNTFESIVNSIADSFQYEGHKSMAGTEVSVEEADRLSYEQTGKNIWKWLGIILTISIVLGLIRMVFFR